MTDKKKIRNAFVVDPQGNVEEREMPEHIAPLVNNLENIHSVLRKANEKSRRNSEQ